MIIDCTGCLHGHFPKLEGGDLLIVTGDLTANDSHGEHIEFSHWINQQKYRKIIIIAGNHDNYLKDKKGWKSEIYPSEYLCDSGTEFEGLKIWGSPFTPWFSGVNPHCKAFMKSDNSLSNHWEKIPHDIDILITHGPPYGIRDGVPTKDGSLLHVGCKSLALEMGNRKNPPFLWVFSHIHEGYGEDLTIREKECKMINCSHVNAKYKPVNPPIRLII